MPSPAPRARDPSPVAAEPAAPGAARWLLWIFVLALLVRVGVVLQLQHTIFAQAVVGDGHFYDRWARQIAGGDLVGRDANFLTPLYAYFLALIYWTCGHGWLAVRLVQALLGALTSVLVADATARLFDRRAGLIAGVVTALYAPMVWMEATIHKTALEVVLVAAFMALIARLAARRRIATLLGCGAVTACLALTRENAVILLPVAALWLLLEFRREPLAARLRWIAALTLGFVVVLGPFVLRNRLVVGEWSLTYNFGMNFWIGNNHDADGLYDPLVPGHGRAEQESVDAIAVPEAALGHKLAPLETSAWWFYRTLADIRTDPLRWLRLLGRKAMLVWNADEQMDSESFQAYADDAGLLWVLGLPFRFGLLAPLAAVGLWITRRDWRRLWPLHAAIASLALSITLFFVFARIRISIAVFLIPFAAAGLASLLTQWGAWSRSERLRSALLLVGCGVLVNWPLAASSGDPRAATWVSYAVTLLDEGQADRALDLLRKASAREPDDAVLHNDLGVALKRTGDLDGAAIEFRAAVRLRPDYPDALLNLSIALSGKRDAPGALAACRQALALQPDFPMALSHLGFLLYKGGDLTGAIEAWMSAMKLDPSDVKSQSNLAAALAQHGDINAAITAWRQVLHLAPGDEVAQKNLDRLLASRPGR